MSLQDEWKSSDLHVLQQLVKMKDKKYLCTDASAVLAKKRRLVDILSAMNSPQETMSNEEHVKEELSHYLGYNQPEINSSPLEWWKCHSKDLLYLSILSKRYLSVCATSCPLRGCSVLVGILLHPSTTV